MDLNSRSHKEQLFPKIRENIILSALGGIRSRFLMNSTFYYKTYLISRVLEDDISLGVLEVPQPCGKEYTNRRYKTIFQRAFSPFFHAFSHHSQR